MKIHFEGRYYELERVSLFLKECEGDIVVMETSKIKEKGENSNYYCLDVETISAIPKTYEESLYLEEKLDGEDEEIDNQCSNAPHSQIAMCKYGFWDIVDYIRFDPDASKEEIVKYILRWHERILVNRKAIEKFERNGGEEYED